nr:hypothetical protein [Tanacetum cinerariifolium]
MPNNSQVKVKKTQVEVHPRIPSVSNKMKSVTACKDSLNSRTLNVNDVCATCNKCLVDSNHFACVTKMLNDVNARTKKPNVVPISTRKPKSQEIPSFELKVKDSVCIILRYDGDEYDKGRMPTKIELTLEQSQQGASNDVLAETGSIHMLSVFTKVNYGIEDKTSWT